MKTLLVLMLLSPLFGAHPSSPAQPVPQPELLRDRLLPRADQDRLRTAIQGLKQRGLAPLTLTMPRQLLYVGSYTRIPVSITKGTGLTFDDLAFWVVEGPQGGTVSESKDATFNAKRLEPLLIAGYAPGSYTLEVTRKGTNIVLAKGKFKTSVAWRANGD